MVTHHPAISARNGTYAVTAGDYAILESGVRRIETRVDGYGSYTTDDGVARSIHSSDLLGFYSLTKP